MQIPPPTQKSAVWLEETPPTPTTSLFFKYITPLVAKTRTRGLFYQSTNMWNCGCAKIVLRSFAQSFVSR